MARVGQESTSMKTTFEIAIDKHEPPDFFKGNGIY
jgi:hypothetical protein